MSSGAKGKGKGKKGGGSGGAEKKKAEGPEALRSELDKVSQSSDTEDTSGKANEAQDYFDAEPVNGSQAPTLTDEEREEMKLDLQKTEDEIQTLRQVLQARMKHSNELKRKLGLTPWVEFQNDLGQTFKNVQESAAYQNTTSAIKSTSGVVANKLGQLKNSSAFKSFGESVGGAYSTVKAKLAASTSIDHLYGQTSPGGSQAGTGANTPNTEKSPLS